MTRTFRLLRRLLLGSAFALAAAPAPGAPPDAPPRLGLREADAAHRVFSGAILHQRPGRVIEGASLVIGEGRVAAAGAGVSLPEAATTRDLAGRHVYPGFIDPYTDYGQPAVPAPAGGRREAPRYGADRSGGRAWNEAIHAEFVAFETFRPDPLAADTLRARGVTTVYSGRPDGIFRGRGLVAALGTSTEAPESVLVPHSWHVLSLSKGSSGQAYPDSQMGAIALLRQTFLDAAWWAAARDTPGPDLPADRALEALATASGPFLFVAGDADEIPRIRRLAEETGRRFLPLVGADAFEQTAGLAASGTPVLLSLSLPKTPDVGEAGAELDVSLRDLRRWERAPTTAVALAEAGVSFAWTGHGLRLEEDFWANLRRTVAAGLDPATALAALTTEPAALLGIEDQAGTLEPGRRADFVIASGDLLRDPQARIEEVWVGGERVWRSPEASRVDARGAWDWELAGRQFTVVVDGGAGAPQVELRLPDGRVEAAIEVVAEADRLHFRAPWDGNTARLRLQHTASAVLGWAVLPDGRTVAARVTPAAAQPAPTPETVDPAPPAGTPVSRQTHPNVAFGIVQEPAMEEVLFRGATVWTNEEAGVLEDADVLIRNGRIAAVGPGLEAPDGARVVEAAGMHLTPGIVDEHSHLAIAGGVNEGSHASTAEVRIGDVVDPADIGIYRALAGGTTTAQLLHGSANPIGGQAQVIKLRWGADAAGLAFTAAPPSIKFALGENVKQSNWGEAFTQRYPQTRMGVEAFLRDRFLAARAWDEEWAAWSDLSPRQRQGKRPPRRDLELAALAEVLRGERLIHCHSYVQSEILMMMRLAEEFGFRVQTFTHVLEGYKVAPELAAHGAGASTFSDWWAYKMEVQDAIPANACLLLEAGVLTSLSSDSHDLIRRLNSEAGKMVAHCGLDEQEALKLVTLYPARQLAVGDRIGSLAPGKDADLVLWDGHPLSMYSRVEQTWVDGRLRYGRARDALERTALREERAALVQAVLQTGRQRDEPAPAGSELDDDDPAAPMPDASLHAAQGDAR